MPANESAGMLNCLVKSTIGSIALAPMLWGLPPTRRRGRVAPTGNAPAGVGGDQLARESHVVRPRLLLNGVDHESITIPFRDRMYNNLPSSHFSPFATNRIVRPSSVTVSRFSRLSVVISRL